ncbi:trans-2-enoyl-CoA reductase [Bradyrhizobium sp. i1.8.4]
MPAVVGERRVYRLRSNGAIVAKQFSLVFPMKAMEYIIAGYVSLKDRGVLEEIVDQRERLLNETRMRSVPCFSPR